MNKKVILIVVALLLLLAVGAGVMLMKNTVTPATNNTTSTVTQPEPTKPQVGTSLKDLLTNGKSQRCYYTASTENTTVSTAIYVANGKMRGDIDTTSNEFNLKSHMIVDSTYTYFWSENTNKGFKILIDEKPVVTPSQQNQSVDLNQKINYTCENWNKIDSYFDLPANITFQTMTVPTQGSASVTGEPVDQCAACDNLPAGEAQNACKTALKCK